MKLDYCRWNILPSGYKKGFKTRWNLWNIHLAHFRCEVIAKKGSKGSGQHDDKLKRKMDTPEPTEAQEHKKKAVQRVWQDVCIYIHHWWGISYCMMLLRSYHPSDKPTLWKVNERTGITVKSCKIHANQFATVSFWFWIMVCGCFSPPPCEKRNKNLSDISPSWNSTGICHFNPQTNESGYQSTQHSPTSCWDLRCARACIPRKINN